MQRLLPGIVATVLVSMSAVLAAESLPFDPDRGLVEVDVVINGHATGRFGIDTGADGLYIDRAFAVRHGLVVTDTATGQRVVGINGDADTETLRVRSLAIGGERLHNLTATSADLTRLTGSKERVLDGLIGHDVLRDFFVTVDYPGRTLTLQREWPSYLNDRSAEALPFRLEGHLIVVNATFGDELTVAAALDYCASLTVVCPRLAEKLGLDGDMGRRVEVGTIAIDHCLVTEDVLAVVGDLTQISNRVAGADIQVLLGGSFLYRHKLTIDYRRKRIIVHRP